jgi:altronate hydrolase
MNLSLIDTPASTDRSMPVPLPQIAIRLHPDDNVAIARQPLLQGMTLRLEDDTLLSIQETIPPGHKLALRSVAVGGAVRRYGQFIGAATKPIQPGAHVHAHNLSVAAYTKDYAVGVDVKPVALVPAAQRRTFMGYLRADGRVGTRNTIAVISSVNCSAHTVRQIAAHFTHEVLAAYPNVDDVIAVAHASGCGARLGGADYQLLQRTLAGMANNPNVGGYILVGLGCEVNQVQDLINNYGLQRGVQGQPPVSLTIQESGGIRKTVQAGIEAVKALLPVVNATARTPQPISGLNVALQCGGSDGWSGVTANPALGLAVDELVRQGGTAVLSETTEIYGAEHLLTRRAINPHIAEKLIGQVHWWEEHTRRLNIEIDNNPSPGNKAGGLTTIYEKSLGAVAKGGNTPLTAVYAYAEPITERGMVFMDTPGYDPVSATGQVAGGCNLIVFTTGRGSVFGFKPAPSIKVATNSALYRQMEDDMDIDAGKILEGVPMVAVAAEILDEIIAVASGKQSKSEAQGVGADEFNPWNLGGTL